MKRLLMLLLLHPFAARSCDFCNGYLGLNPHFKKNSISLRYHYMHYNGTEMSAADLHEMGLNKNDFYETRTNYELFGQFYPVQKMQVIVSLPYVRNTDAMSERAKNALGIVQHAMHGNNAKSKNTYEGLGDALILLHYQLFNSMASDSLGFSHRLLAGPGIKLPTGACKVETNSEAHLFAHQPGSGSWDVMLSTIYLAKINKLGFSFNASYMMTTENQNQFRFGNKWNTSLTAFYQINLKKFNIIPGIGCYWEQASKDTYFNDTVTNSGGDITLGHLGIDVYYKRFALSAAMHLPFIHNLNGHQAEMNYRFITGLSYAFN